MPNIPPQAEKFLDDLDKHLHEPGAITNIFAKIEQKTGVKRLHIFGGICFLSLNLKIIPFFSFCVFLLGLFAVWTLGAILLQLDWFPLSSVGLGI